MNIVHARCSDGVLGQPMSIPECGDRMTLGNRLGTIELMRARQIAG